MPNYDKKLRLTGTSLAAICLATLFVVAYIFIIVYTYTNLFENATDSVLNSTVNTATSMSRIIEADVSQMNVLAAELNAGGKNYDKDKDAMTQYLVANKPEDCIMLSFFYADQTDGIVCSTSFGVTSNVGPTIEQFEAAIADAPIFATNITPNYRIENVETSYVYYYRKIVTDGNVLGYLVATYDYSTTLKDSYSSQYYDIDALNLMFTSDGTIILNEATNESDFYNLDNLSTFLAEHSYTGTAITEGSNAEASINTFVTDRSKYVIAISPIDSTSNIYIARILPSRALFEDTGDLLIFMTLASFMFFFAIVLIAYRYYKSVSETSRRIKDIAYTDPLTGFTNFAKFKEDAEDVLKEEQDKDFYIACIDIIGFRYINDAFGYDVGDQILIAITNEINEILGDDELFARVTADKYVILTKNNYSDPENNFIYKLTDRISTIGPLAKSHIKLEVQMGVYKILPEDIENLSINAIYDRALVALYSIEHVDTGVAVYDVAIHNEQIEKKDIESRMHQALKDGEFRVYVQPKYRTSNAKLAAGEALIRWIDPEKGIVPPIKFIPLFEQNRFVHDIDVYVMEVVARFQRMRLNEGLPVVPISLNISPVEFTMPGFRESYISIKEKYDIPDKLIELEFTEGIFFDNEELFKDVIRDFHEHGFTCSMDDFGSGYSSLNILKDLPVDTLKLDKLFFRESDNTSRDRSIIRSVVAMARSLNIKTVAEGVETLDVVEFLKLIGCTLIQGYIYSKPLPLTEFEERLDSEPVDTDDEFELDFDKFEVVPLDMPLSNSLDSSLRRTYAAILEINAGGNIYHLYYPGGDEDSTIEKLPERGFYNALCEDLIPKFVHPKDLDEAKRIMNPMNLTNHFKQNAELDFEYRHMRKDGSYSWVKLHIIKASGGRADSQIFFGYFNIIDDYKEKEENLSVIQNRFSAAYKNLNGVVFELDLNSGNIDMLETHSNLLNAVKDVHDVKQLVGFVIEYLLHPDYKEKLLEFTDLEKLKEHFSAGANMPSLTLDVLAKSSRKVSRYSVYRITLAGQVDHTKVLLTIEDVTEEKAKEANSDMRHHVTDVAFANSYELVTYINLEKDLYMTTSYPSLNMEKAQTSEGKYSLHVNSLYEKFLKPDSIETMKEIFSLEGLRKFYNDPSTSEFKLTFEELPYEGADHYVWRESLIVAPAEAYGQDPCVFVFKRTIQEMREAESNLNEYAHRLSYSLAMFDYAFSVGCEDEHVELIGGLRFDTDIFDSELSYQDVITLVKNTEITESEQAAFRRFTYLDELIEYFASNPATLTRYFTAVEEGKISEVSIIYGARERKITYFVRQIDKSNIQNI